MPVAAATRPDVLDVALASIALTAFPPVSPNSDRNCVNRLPRTASAPKNSPATLVMRAYSEEMNRLNRERRLSIDIDRRALTDAERKIKDIVTVIENGGYKPALLDRLDELELQRGKLRERLAQAAAAPPDIHPNVSEIFRAKVARLADTLNNPADRAEAAQAIRNLIARVVLTPGPDPGELKATLEGELGTILEWVARQTTNDGRTKVRGVSVSVVAGACIAR